MSNLGLIQEKPDLAASVVCCNAECGRTWRVDECVTSKHGGPPLCPECYEVTEPVDGDQA